MLKKRLTVLLTLIFLIVMNHGGAIAGEKATSSSETSMGNPEEELSQEQAQEEDENQEHEKEKGYFNAVLIKDGKVIEERISIAFDNESQQIYIGLSAICKLLGIEYSLNASYAEVTTENSCFDLYPDSAEAMFVGFSEMPFYPLTQIPIFERTAASEETSEAQEVWIGCADFLSLSEMKGLIWERCRDDEWTQEDAVLLLPETMTEDELAECLEDAEINSHLAAIEVDTLRKISSFKVTPAYYRFLQEKLIPEYGLASESNYGLLSADIRDFNGDGVEELLVLDLVSEPYEDTFIERLEELEYDNAGFVHRDCTAIRAGFYTLIDGEIQKADEKLIQMIETPYIGKIKVYLVSMDSQWYLNAFSAWEDWSTVGDNFYRPGIILSVDEQGQFVMESLYGNISFGQHAAGIESRGLPESRGIDFTDTVVRYASSQAVEDKTLLCAVEITANPGRYVLDDRTFMQKALEEGEDTVESVSGDISKEFQDYLDHQTRKQSEEDTRVNTFCQNYGEQIEQIKTSITSGTGMRLVEKEEKYSLVGQQYVRLYLITDTELKIYFTFNEETGELTNVSLYSSLQRKKEWNLMKDAIIMSPAFEFECFQKYMGDLNSVLDDGKTDSNWRFSIVNINNWIFEIQRIH